VQGAPAALPLRRLTRSVLHVASVGLFEQPQMVSVADEVDGQGAQCPQQTSALCIRFLRVWR